MGFLVDYNGGIHAEDYTLVDHGDGNGFGLRSECCGILNNFDAVTEEGVIELTLEHATYGAGISLGDADRIVMTAEDAEDLINTLKEAIEEAEAYQWELRKENEKKECEKKKITQ